jgi:hypothetical protein
MVPGDNMTKPTSAEQTPPEAKEVGDEQIQVRGAIHEVPFLGESRSRLLFEHTLRTHQMPAVVDLLTQLGHDDSWVVFMFYTARPSAKTSDDCLNLQYSIINGVTGMDWVLLGERNIVDRARVSAFVRRQGFQVSRQEMNDVAYLRVEGDGVRALGQKIAEEVYGLTEAVDVGLLVDGFSLPVGWQSPR